jgi:hypothetical protein
MGAVIAKFGGRRFLEALAILLLAGGSAVFLFVKQPFEFWTINFALGGAATGLGGFLAFCALVPHYVLVCEEGIVVVQGRQVGCHRWQDIASVDHREVFQDRFYKPIYTLRVVAVREGNSVTIGNEGNVSAMDLTNLTSRHFLDIQLQDGTQIDLQYVGRLPELARELMREMQRNAVKNLLKEAISLEANGQLERAIVTFEEVIRKSPYNQIAEQAKTRIAELHAKLAKGTDWSRTRPAPERANETDIRDIRAEPDAPADRPRE